MRTVFYKSLDRPVNVFGLKGQWVNVFLYMLGGSLAGPPDRQGEDPVEDAAGDHPQGDALAHRA